MLPDTVNSVVNVPDSEIQIHVLIHKLTTIKKVFMSFLTNSGSLLTSSDHYMN